MLDVIIGILKFYDYDMYSLLDPGVTLSFITPFIASRLDMSPKMLCEPFLVSTPIGKSILLEESIGVAPSLYCIKFCLVILLSLTW